VENRKGLIIDSQDGNEIAAKYPGLLPEMKVGYRSFLSVPLISGDQPIGSLHFRSKRSGFYSEKDLRLAESIGNHIAGAIANAQLYLERKRAEEGLREREERLRLIAENARVVIWMMDMNLRYTYISPYIKHNLDYTPEEYVLKPLHEVLTPSSLELCMQLFAEEMEEEKRPGRDLYRSRTIEVEHIHRDGRIIWAEIHMTFIRDAAGKAVGILGITRDITERKRVEKALRQSEETARRLAMENEVVAEIGRIISSSVNIDEVYDHFAQEAKKIIHFDRITVSIFDLAEMSYFLLYTTGVEVPGFHKGDRHPIRIELLEKAGRMRPGIIYQVSAEREAQGEEEIRRQLPSFLPLYQAGLRSFMRIPLISKDEPIGSLNFLSREFEAYSESDLRVGGKVANQIAGAIANAQLFQKQKRTEEELFKSGERYRRLVEISPLMISVQKEGKYVYLNPAALKALGASKPEELLGRSIFEMIHPDYWDAARERLRLAEQGKAGPLIEEKIIRLDKKVIDVELSQIEVFDRDERAVMVVGRDITEQKKAEKEKAVLQEQLQQAQKMEAIGTLAGGIAHDFNNILAGILGYAELAGLDIPEGSKARYNLQQSIKSAHRAKDLVSQILAFSRQGAQERKPLDIRPVVKEGLKFLRSSLPATIEIRQGIEEELGAIEADPTQVYQVLMNLCTNAAHAMGDHGGVLEVSLNKVDLDEGMSAPSVGIEPGPYLRLRVRDTGHGMTPDVLKRIFDPYFTTKEVGKGTGMGLAVVHGIVKNYGGGIAVSSEVGKGSTFDIYFPRIEGVSLGLVAEKVEPLPLGGHERVLFVDDEQTIVEVGQKILEHLGYDVVARTSSVEALELFKATPERFDLVIMDMTMPNMTGDRLAQEILGIRPRIPVILCTGFSEYISEERAKTLGIREFVLKPLIMKDLAKAMRRALDSRKKKKGRD